MTAPVIAAITIGRNEGTRLIACLTALRADPGLSRIVYVDSGSTDGSVAAARDLGVQVVLLKTNQPFTAARARNAGLAALRNGTSPNLVQFVDGDCVLDPGWIATATTFLADHPRVAVVCGRRREMHPEASVYNRLCDAEWDTPVGETRACGGDALMRWDALEAVGGYNPTLIAGEEPEMCLRLRRRDWQIWRINAEMTLHDAAITCFSQFWTRMRRSGFAAAEGAAMYGTAPERHGVSTLQRAFAWSAVLPAAILLVLLLGHWALLLLLVYPMQVARIALRDGGGRSGWERAWFLTLSKFAEARGALGYGLQRLRRQRAEIIEYK